MHGVRVGSLVGVWMLVLALDIEAVGMGFLQLALMCFRAICRSALVQAFSVQF